MRYGGTGKLERPLLVERSWAVAHSRSDGLHNRASSFLFKWSYMHERSIEPNLNSPLIDQSSNNFESSSVGLNDNSSSTHST